LKLQKLAPVLFVALWSTGFVGAKYGLPYADPFIFLSLRVLVAALVLLFLARLMKMRVRLSRTEVVRSAIIGFFLHACYLGGVFYSIASGMPAGTAAVVTSLQPVLVSILAIKILGEKLRSRQVIGLLLGLVGVVLVLSPSNRSEIPSVAVLAIVIALIGSTSATLLQKKFGSEIPLVAGTAYQYLATGIVLGAIALLTDKTSITWSHAFTASFIWLVLVLSVGAILILLWLLNSGSAASVSSLFFLVPPVTALEAFILFGEKLNTQGFLGIGVCALGVWLVIRR
jgi:drug/metabolite transporter (DMT)-like permease